MIKGILFDMGDTLIHNINMDFKKGIEYLYNKSIFCITTKENFIDQSYSILNDIFDSRTILEFKMIDYIELLISLFFLKFNINIDEIEEEFAFTVSSFDYVKDAEKILKFFKFKNYKIILMSNTSFSRRVVLKMLGNLVQYFDEIIISSETVFRKPSEYFFEIGVRKLSLEKNNIYYIGNDYYYDVFGASNSGINSIWFNENHSPIIEKYRIKNCKIIHKYSDLIDENF